MSKQELAKMFKALSDENRLHIISLLSDGEMCACKLLDTLAITLPTLSHHMKILCDVGLVNARKDGKWTHYAINNEGMKKLQVFMDGLKRG